MTDENNWKPDIFLLEDHEPDLTRVHLGYPDLRFITAVTVRWAMQALDHMDKSSVFPPRAIIVDGSLEIANWAWESVEYFDHTLKSSDDYNSWAQEKKTTARKVPSSWRPPWAEYFSEIGQTRPTWNRDLLFQWLENHRGNHGGFITGLLIELIKSKWMEAVPLCFLLNSSKAQMNDINAGLVDDANLSNATVIKVPRISEPDWEWSQKNHLDALKELHRWLLANPQTS